MIPGIVWWAAAILAVGSVLASAVLAAGLWAAALQVRRGLEAARGGPAPAAPPVLSAEPVKREDARKAAATTDWRAAYPLPPDLDREGPEAAEYEWAIETLEHADTRPDSDIDAAHELLERLAT